MTDNTEPTLDLAARRRRILAELYGDRADAITAQVEQILDRRRGARRAAPELDQSAAWVIAYADHLTMPDRSPIAALDAFVGERLRPAISGVHTLPIHPSTSDGGFSVVDPALVDPAYGDWADIERLASRTTWMADAVVNHMSAESPWFRSFLAGDPGFEDFFVRLAPGTDTTAVLRPRTSPLSHQYPTADGPVEIWTTFSADQVDLDYRNPAVLVAMTEVLLRYVDHGARAIRLDAVAFLWKDPARSSVGLAETHAIVGWFRSVLDDVAPDVVLVSEINLPHAENVSFLGSTAEPEAAAVYQFALPPLVLHTMLSGSTEALRRWARDEPVPAQGTYLNFLASHDGIGLRPAEGILDTDAVGAMVAATIEAGGVVNERSTIDGGSAPYELAVAWFDLMAVGHDEDVAIARHLVAHAIVLALRGVPLLYVNSLFGIGNDRVTFERTGHGRDLNRRRSSVAELEEALEDPTSRAARTWWGMQAMLDARRATDAFHPSAGQIVHETPDGVLLVERRGVEHRALVVINVTGTVQEFGLPPGRWTATRAIVSGGLVTLGPWGIAWLEAFD